MIGAEIEAARLAIHYTRQDVWDATLIPQKRLAEIESGHDYPTPPLIVLLAHTLGVDPARWLWLWVERELGAVHARAAAGYGLERSAEDG